MAPETKIKWRKEIDWLLSVTDHIVEFVPSQQVGKDGANMEVINSSIFPSPPMSLPFFLLLLSTINAYKFQILIYICLFSDADYDHSAAQRSSVEHSCTAQAGCYAYCKIQTSFSYE